MRQPGIWMSFWSVINRIRAGSIQIKSARRRSLIFLLCGGNAFQIFKIVMLRYYYCGGYYRYSGKNIYYCIINDTMHYGSPNAEVGGKRYDARTAVLIHEMLHCVETNSVLRGWSGFQPLHDSEKNGYVYSKELEWIDWYADLMQDRIKNGQGKGFRPESFYVPHRPK